MMTMRVKINVGRGPHKPRNTGKKANEMMVEKLDTLKQSLMARDAAHDVRTLESSEIFRGANEIIIRHDGAVYRMKITRQGKLILNK
jgi:hemin uptake protein HemP